jgi:dihydroxy-acid dehydratase
MTVTGKTIGEMIEKNDIRRENLDEFARQRSLAAPGNVRTKEASSQNKSYDTPDRDAVNGCIRAVEFAYSQDGGLAVLYGNIAERGVYRKNRWGRRVDLGDGRSGLHL